MSCYGPMKECMAPHTSTRNASFVSSILTHTTCHTSFLPFSLGLMTLGTTGHRRHTIMAKFTLTHYQHQTLSTPTWLDISVHHRRHTVMQVGQGGADLVRDPDRILPHDGLPALHLGGFNRHGCL